MLSLPVFLIAAFAMYASGMPRIAIAFGLVATINTGILIGLDDVVGGLQRATQIGDGQRSPRRPTE
jgi:hypothetical protein